MTLDLHGKKHGEVEDLVENFVLLNDPPIKIITGNSQQMKAIVTRVLRQHKFRFTVGDRVNQGYITILSDS